MASPNPNGKSSDVDFTDVFGGSPRRSSINELRRSRADSLDSGSWRGSGSGSGLGERPVFGEVSSPARRRQLRDDFFNDVFQSSESACSSRRRGERDALNSPTLGSQILSPIRPLPPVSGEAVAGGPSLPPQLRELRSIVFLVLLREEGVDGDDDNNTSCLTGHALFES